MLPIQCLSVFMCLMLYTSLEEWMEIRTQNLELDAMHKFVRLNLCYVCHGRVIVIPFHLLMMKFRNGPKIGVEIICRTLNMWYPENTFMCRAIYQNKHEWCTLANKLKRNLGTLNHTEYNVSHLHEDGFRHLSKPYPKTPQSIVPIQGSGDIE